MLVQHLDVGRVRIKDSQNSMTLYNRVLFRTVVSEVYKTNKGFVVLLYIQNFISWLDL